MTAEDLLRTRDGRNANLQGANLRNADLQGANLRGADLWDANLQGADLWDANLWDANLRYANLQGANLQGANLQGANLRYANLRGADLWDANLWDANLQGANLRDASGISPLIAARLFVPPESGAFYGWKRCASGTLVRLYIPADAKRSSATSRKCRASHAKVVEIVGAEGAARSLRRPDFLYELGKYVVCHEWDPDRWNECSGGIHFYMTRVEAEAHQ